MQRSSNTTARNIIIGSVIVLLLVSVLYYLKRVEVYHLKKNMDSLQDQRSDHEEELNSKLTDYLQKLDDMTRQLGDLNSRMQECEDSKASVTLEVQKCKEVYTECSSGKERADKDMEGLRRELETAKGQHSEDRSQLSSHEEAAQNAKQALAGSEKELEQCDLEKDACRDSKTRIETQLHECQQILSQCQSAVKGGRAGGFNAFQQSQPQGPGQNQGSLGRQPQMRVVDTPAKNAPNHNSLVKKEARGAPPVGGAVATTTEMPVPPQAPDKDPVDQVADPLNANGEDDDRPGGGIDDVLAVLEHPEGGAARDGHALPDGPQKAGEEEPKANEEMAEEDQELEAVRELEDKVKEDVVI